LRFRKPWRLGSRRARFGHQGSVRWRRCAGAVRSAKGADISDDQQADSAGPTHGSTGAQRLGAQALGVSHRLAPMPSGAVGGEGRTEGRGTPRAEELTVPGVGGVLAAAVRRPPRRFLAELQGRDDRPRIDAPQGGYLGRPADSARASREAARKLVEARASSSFGDIGVGSTPSKANSDFENSSSWRGGEIVVRQLLAGGLFIGRGPERATTGAGPMGQRPWRSSPGGATAGRWDDGACRVRRGPTLELVRPGKRHVGRKARAFQAATLGPIAVVEQPDVIGDGADVHVLWS